MSKNISQNTLGISGRIAAYFQTAPLTPLLAIVALLLGIFAVLVTPREEEPQIDVTMVNLIVPFPGASVKEVEALVATPAEQILAQMQGVEHVYSMSRPGVAVMTVQFKVGVTRKDAMVRLYENTQTNANWLPQGLGVMQPLIQPKGIDDVPIVSLTLYSKKPTIDTLALQQVAHSIEADLQRVPGTREVYTIGAPGRAVMVEIDPQRLNAAGITVHDVRNTLQSANMGLPVGKLIAGNQAIQIDAGAWLGTADDVANLMVGVPGGKPVLLKELAQVREGSPAPQRYVWLGVKDNAASGVTQEYPAVTVAITKKAGENAIDIANALQQRVSELKNTVIPDDVEVLETRNYGTSANEKAMRLIQELVFATLSVIALILFTLGKREAVIVGGAVLLTLTATLFASWAWGFTLNRVSLFALIFSIGILVDDAIVVVENISRHQQLFPNKTLREIIPTAVDEVGGPTILATLAVISALLPMAFVSGLMGPYMSPIPINASMGMMLSLIVAIVVTPWLSRIWMRPVPAEQDSQEHGADEKIARKLDPIFRRVFKPLLHPQTGKRNRGFIGLLIMGLVSLSLLLPAVGWVVLKMLPFDNKDELQIIVDMPAGTPVEKTAAVLQELGDYVLTVPEVKNYQAYAGTAAPINFNGLVRQYYLRTGGVVGDLQVNLAHKDDRDAQSHDIAMRERAALQEIGRRHGANVKIVEVPPGPPVLSPIVAEVYAPDESTRIQTAKAVRAIFEDTQYVVDVDDTTMEASQKINLIIDRRKAAQLGVPQAEIVAALRTGLSGDLATWIHNTSRYAVPARVQLPAHMHGNLDLLLQLSVRNGAGQLIPIRELVTIHSAQSEQPIFHKNLLPVVYVLGDVAGGKDSPLYGMFAMRDRLKKIQDSNGEPLQEYFISQPQDAYRSHAIKWDGEWQITYETFRDMGLAYSVGLAMIYLLLAAQFRSYSMPLIIMVPIPLTIIGVMPGHALLSAQFTATSMIGMIALAGIIVRNSILLVDFIGLQLHANQSIEEAIVTSAITRAYPIMLTGVSTMLGAVFLLSDPIFNGLAVSLIFGILASSVLTLVVIPILYYIFYKLRWIPLVFAD